MRKLFIILFCFVFLLLLVSCDGFDDVETNSKKDLQRLESSSVYVYVDPETKVNYLIYAAGYKGGICVRYDSEGNIFISED